MANDNLFKTKQNAPFEFNAEVAHVFDDMLNRSVPMYANILRQIAQISAHVLNPGQTIYDCGCSTGALVPYLKNELHEVSYLGLDASAPMIDKAGQFEQPGIHFKVADIQTFDAFEKAGVIVCNLVLQFIPKAKRQACLNTMWASLEKGGALIVVEKLHQASDNLEQLYTDAFYALKSSNGYSDDEIKHKAEALTGVLMTQTHREYMDLFSKIGILNVDVFFKWYNFCGYVAIKT